MKRRYKLLIIIFISFILVYFLYLFLYKKQNTYVGIGSNLSFNNSINYSYQDLISKHYQKTYYFHTSFNSYELLNSLASNRNNINVIIHKADLVTLCLDNSELNQYIELNEEEEQNFYNNIKKSISIITSINNNLTIIFLNQNNNVNAKIKELQKDYYFKYIDELESGKKEYYSYKYNYVLTPKGANILAKSVNQ